MATQQVFVALQCFACSTMQVKQLKKSNQWVCAVCNQRQSLRKVFARSYLAKDVRDFVQRSNMARSLAGESANPVPSQICTDSAAEYGDPAPCFSTRPLVDWSRYLDPDEEEEGFQSDPTVVTEMPSRGLNKRTSLRKSPPKSGTPGEEEPRRTNFKEPISGLRPQVTRGDEKRLRLAAEGLSKWSEYLKEDTVYETLEAGATSPELNATFDSEFQSQQTGAIFDEEVHPDFL